MASAMRGAQGKHVLKGTALHNFLGEEASKRNATKYTGRDKAAIADTPLRWLLLGLDDITSDFAPPPPDLAIDASGLPPPPPPTASAKKKAKGKTGGAKPAKVAAKAKPKPKPKEEQAPSTAVDLPPVGTTERTAARLLLCLRRVVKKQQKMRLQSELHVLVQHKVGADISPQLQQSPRLKQDRQRKKRPRTPDVIDSLRERIQFWEPMHSQVWRRREFLQKPRPSFKRSASATSLVSDAPAGARHSRISALSQATSKAVAVSAFSQAASKAAAVSAFSQAASKAAAGEPSEAGLPPVKDVVKKYQRGAPALGAGFKVLAGFRTETGPTRSSSVGVSGSTSHAKVLTLEGTVDLLKDVGIWPKERGSVLRPQQNGLSKSAGALPPLSDAARATLLKPAGLPTESSMNFAQASTELGEPSAAATLSLDELELRDDGDDYSVSDATFNPLDVPYINPLAVFPDLARRAPLPARRIYFTDPDGVDAFTMRDPVDILDIDEPPPVATPSSVQSLSDYNLLMASVMRGSLATGTMRKPAETTAELSVTMDMGTRGLQEALDEVSSEEEQTGIRHPPSWTRKQSVLHTSGVRDYGDMGPGRQQEMEVDTRAVVNTPQWAYMLSCAQQKVVPKVPRAVVKAIAEVNQDDANTNADVSPRSPGPLSPKSTASTARNHMQFDLTDHCLGDAGLQAFGETMSMLGPIQLLNLSGNKLSDKATSDFLELRSSHLGTVKEFDLSRNQQLGSFTVQTVVNLLHDDKFRLLESLNICSLLIPDKLYPPLMKALLESGTLRALSIADTRLGFGRQEPVHAVAELLADGVLTTLDISGNFIRGEGAEAFARALEKTHTLGSLDLSHNAGDHLGAPEKLIVKPKKQVEAEPSAEAAEKAAEKATADLEDELPDNPPFSALVTILEGLLCNTTLQKLSLSQCSMDYAADFVLGEVLLRHPLISEMDLSSNPHGVPGLACLLRAIGVPHSPVRLLNVKDARTEQVSMFAAKYNFRDPSGRYVLRLTHPQHRSVLRTLLERPPLEGKDSKACFRDVSGQLSFGAPVPTEGSVSFSYGVPAPSTPRGDNHPLAKAQYMHRRGLSHVNFERALIVAAAYSTCCTEEQKIMFLQAMCTCFLLKSSHLNVFLQGTPQTLNLQAFRCLAPNIGDSGETLELAQLLRNPEERAQARKDLRALTFLNLRNPTGRYRLHLFNSCDRACALRLQALAAFEAALRERQGRPDISQLGNFEPIRNAQHNGHGLLMGEGAKKFEDVVLPFAGILEFDYSTYAKARANSEGIPTPILENLSAAIKNSKASRSDTLNAFRSIADRFCMSASDVRHIIKTFAALPDLDRQTVKNGMPKPPKFYIRVETLLACFGCTADRAAVVSSVLYGAESLTPEDCSKLRHRLGPVAVFDWARCDESETNLPAGNTYKLNLAVNDERVVAKFLLNAASQEGLPCLVEPEWSVSKLALKPPDKVAQWVNAWLADFPSKGTFKVTYVEASDSEQQPSDVFKMRRDIADKLGFDR